MPVNPDISAYYQQLNVANGVIKTGDYVYVQMESGKMICQIDTVWANKEYDYFPNVYLFILFYFPQGAIFRKRPVLFTSS